MDISWIVANIHYREDHGVAASWHDVCKMFGIGNPLTLEMSMILAREGRDLPECKLLRGLSDEGVKGDRVFGIVRSRYGDKIYSGDFYFLPPDSLTGRPLSFWIG